MQQPTWDEEKQGWRIGGVIIRLKNLEQYHQNDKNPVSHGPRNWSTVLESIRKFGGLRSGVSSKGKLIAGNLTSEAMMEAGIEQVLEVESDGQTWLMHERPDLTEEQQRLAAYFDQAAAMQATWSAEQVAADAEAAVDLSGVFYEWEQQDILAAIHSEVPHLDELAGQYGEPQEGDFWPVVKVQVPPETYAKYELAMAKMEGANEADKFDALISCAL